MREEESIPSNVSFLHMKWNDDGMPELAGIQINGSGTIISPDPEYHTASIGQCIDAVMEDPLCAEWLPEEFKTPEFALITKLS